MLTALRALALLLLGGFVWSAATSRAVGPNWADPLKSLVDMAAGAASGAPRVTSTIAQRRLPLTGPRWHRRAGALRPSWRLW
ncbi:hypothetical protein [Sphingomonas bacterium]|uniref:hypothetical protein n=1 Tax=Sphingomonas bacterium TaxID=1895847 RepID=UPI0026295763|nr:hypothetical protein [Sphingomonas bacterium]